MTMFMTILCLTAQLIFQGLLIFVKQGSIWQASHITYLPSLKIDCFYSVPWTRCKRLCCVSANLLNLCNVHSKMWTNSHAS